MTKEQSYGAILYFIQKKIRYYILVGAIRKNGTIEYWFPKWHPDREDKGNILTTIIREIQEETGITEKYLKLKKFNPQHIAFESIYRTTNKKWLSIEKTSTYYAIKLRKKIKNKTLTVPVNFIHEIDEIIIVSSDDVIQQLSHENEKLLFQQRQASKKI